jgi:hypothetical protein
MEIKAASGTIPVITQPKEDNQESHQHASTELFKVSKIRGPHLVRLNIIGKDSQNLEKLDPLAKVKNFKYHSLNFGFDKEVAYTT